MGWRLSVEGAGVSRKTAKGIPRYQDHNSNDHSSGEHGNRGGDEFMFGGSDLVPTLKADGDETVVDVENVGGFRVAKYRPRIDDQMMRVEKWTSLTDESEVHWRSISSDNVVSIYGETDDSRILDLDAKTGRRCIFSWLLTRSFDAIGNAIMYVYKSEDASNLFPDGVKPIWEQNRSNEERCRQKYLKRIFYTNSIPARDLETWKYSSAENWKHFCWLFEIVMDYGEHDACVPRTTEDKPWSVRQDPFSMANSGFEVRTYRLCRRILMFHRFPEEPGYPSEALVSSTSLEYTETRQGTFLESAIASGHIYDKVDNTRGVVMSYESESLPPSTFTYTIAPDLRKTKAFRVNVINLADMPRPGSLAEWIDLEGEGIPGLLTRLGDGTLSYQRNNGDTTFTAPEVLGQQPSLTTSSVGQFSDLDRSGRLDLVCVNSLGQPEGFYERESDSDTWSEYSDFPQTPVSEPQQQGISIDLTGEGIPDFLLQQSDVEHELIWQQSLGKQGMSGQHRVAALHTDSDTQTTFVADMTGDGLSDLVRIGVTGKITYFPNHGYGSFGAPVEMGSPPVIESMDPTRVRFIDVDGSGPTDLIYILPTGGVHVYFNQAGNSWTDPVLVSRLPRIVDPSSVFVLDLLGQGTACLCWHDITRGSDATMTEIKYIDLMGGSKPHLLQTYKNGMGAMTSVTYSPSTKFYLKDRAAGRPWTTRLPFPVQCVREVTRRDCITNNTSTTEYSYHNGCYDGAEKTFAGFEMVETWERASIPLGKDGVYQAPTSYTRSWFHVGLTLSPDQGDFCTRSHVSSVIEERGETPVLTQEALIALRGKPLRVETYGLDGAPTQHLPYTVDEFSYDVQQLQRLVHGKTKHAVLQVTPRAALVTDYGRALEDGRVTHEVVLSTTTWGDVARSLTIVYPRESKYLTGVPYPDIKTSQLAGHVVMTDYSFTNAIVEETSSDARAFRRPVAWREQTYDSYRFPFRGSILDVDELRSWDADKWSKTLLSESRVLFRNSRLDGPLDPGKIETFSVPEQSFNLAYTPDLVASITAGQRECGITPVTSPDLMVDKILAKAGFVQLEDDKSWWQPSSRQFFTDSDEAQDGISRARRTFYQPTVSVDAFNNRSTMRMDRYNLMVEQTMDALGNIIAFKNDYIKLQPVRITDANQNTQAILRGPLGEVIATGALGKLTSANVFDEVDSLDDVDPKVSEADIESVLTDPNGAVACRLLGSAGSRTVHVLDAFVRAQEPTLTITITRERSFQVPGAPTLHVALTYLQGTGEVLQNVTLEKCSPETEWLVSGCEAAAPVRVFEPFFARTPAFVPVEKWQSNATTAFYDARGACVAQLASDHSWTKAIYSPWKVVQWHEGDTLRVANPQTDPDVGHFFSRVPASRYLPIWLDIQQQQENLTENAVNMAIAQSKVYISQTPMTTFIGCYPAASHIRSIHQAGDGSIFTAAFGYDTAGNQTHSWDNLERLVEMALYDKLGRPIQVRGMGTGEQWSIPDISGMPIVSWNSRGACYHYQYDELRRETECWLTVMPASSTPREQVEGQLVVQTIYGETYRDAVQSNLRGRVWRVRDQAGQHTQFAFDVRGRCIRSGFQAAIEYKAVLDWNTQENTELDESLRYQSRVQFDNLGNAVWEVDVQGNETRRVFSRRGQASKVEFRHISSQPDQWQTYLVDASFNAIGLPLATTYGNGTRTTYTYHPQSRRLVGQRTLVFKPESNKPGATRGEVKEDLVFVYDIAGHQVFKSNKAEKPVFLSGTRIGADFAYTYDAIGQLTSAAGRGKLPAGATQLQPHSAMAGNPDRTGPVEGDRPYNYRESYTYDRAGNMTRMRHEALGGASVSGWTRRFYYEEPSLLSDVGGGGSVVIGNQLSRTTVGKKEQRYISPSDPDDEEWAEGRTTDTETDGHNSNSNSLRSLHDARRVGCMTSLPGFALLRWNAENRLAAASTQRVGDGSTPTITYYVYAHSGQRVRKVTETAATQGGGQSSPRKHRETFFLGATELKIIYEGQVSRRWVATVDSGAGERIALVETDESKSRAVQLARYQVGNDLELDDQGRLVSYEEYSPFGSPIFTTTGRDIQAQREYRFSRYRWDRETGLLACGARYYCPWLGRWTAPDPTGDVDGENLYVYVGNDPINFQDPLGTCGKEKYTPTDWGIGHVAGIRDLLRRANIQKTEKIEPSPVTGLKVNPSKQPYSNNYMRPTESSRQRGKSASTESNTGKETQQTKFKPTPISKGTNEARNIIQTQDRILPVLQSKFNVGKVKEVSGMSIHQKNGVSLLNKDVELSAEAREQTEALFSRLFENLTRLSEKLSNARSLDSETTPNTFHQKKIAEPLKELFYNQQFTKLKKPVYEDGDRYGLIENIIPAMRNFATNSLDPEKAPSDIMEDVRLVETQQHYLFKALNTTVNTQEIDANTASNYAVARLIENRQKPRGNTSQYNKI